MRGEVVLTQGGNAVAGEELEIDLDTGRAEMKGGRVRSIFRPSSRQGAE
jgi:lipopolysaccharide export system protein LptA